MEIKGHYVVIWKGPKNNTSIFWRALAVTLSAVQSLYGGKGDVYLIRGPRTKAEMVAVQSGIVPKGLIYGYARYYTLLSSRSNGLVVPPGHVPRPYVLTVLGD